MAPGNNGAVDTELPQLRPVALHQLPTAAVLTVLRTRSSSPAVVLGVSGFGSLGALLNLPVIFSRRIDRDR
jgi:hypothetical protein